MAAFRAEVVRRSALARRPQPAGVVPPPRRLMFGELRSGLESWLAWRRSPVPMTPASAAGLPVMLLPGFATHPARMYRMRRGLRAAGHWVEDWGLGWNLGGTPEQLDRLCARIEEAAARQGRPVALVGWSLGGLYAREAAKRVPHAVAMVVTMGTPFSGDLHANNAWRAYHWITGHDVAEPPVPGDYAVKPPVPTIALWSARDGIVAPRAARGRAGERDAAVAVRCTHLGFASHPRAVETVADQLSRFAGG
ncbi:alpha/beta hydrolase [Novosphingobium sp. Gsoil 351]|nr:alpha/beta hydrolase [Novosphingobium sp. Gsoil 351]